VLTLFQTLCRFGAVNDCSAARIRFPVHGPAKAGAELGCVLAEMGLHGMPGIPESHRWRRMPQHLLDPREGNPRQHTVNAEGVPEIMDSHIVQIGRLAALPEHFLSLAIAEREGEHRRREPAGIRHPMRGE
jgi:hypothetical protein